MLKVNEIFYSIQGESTYQGLPCVFVRLSGCNLRCAYCDTTYAYEEGELKDIRTIIDRVRDYDCPLVEVTGGEPLIQEETPSLVLALLGEGYRVLLETNGSQDIGKIDERCVKIVDIKCPSSGETDKNDLANLDRLTQRDELKFVIADQEDYRFSKEIVESTSLCLSKRIPVHFSPVYGKMPPDLLAKWILKDGLEVRLHLQLHKLIWGPDERGV